MSLLTRKNSNTHQFSQTFLECVIYGTWRILKPGKLADLLSWLPFWT
jgi:hypothetical protein